MTESLYPVFDIPAEQIEEKENSYRNYSTPLFDVLKGDFVFDSSGKVKTATDREMFIQWCLKACHVERFSKIAYTNGYGAEIEKALKEPTRSAQESFLQRTITDAIKADPYQRAIDVTDFVFKWDKDSVEVEFRIVAVDDLGDTVSIRYGL